MERSPLDLACFRVNGRTCALNVMGIREIVRDAPVTPIPQAPPAIEGVVDLAGRVLPVFDLGRLLGGAAVPCTEDSRIAVLSRAGRVLGMRVEAAVDVLNVDPSELQAPEAAFGAGPGAVEAVVRRDGMEPVLVLEMDALWAAVGAAPEAGAGERGVEAA